MQLEVADGGHHISDGSVSRDGNAYARGAQTVLFRQVDEGFEMNFLQWSAPWQPGSESSLRSQPLLWL